MKKQFLKVGAMFASIFSSSAISNTEIDVAEPQPVPESKDDNVVMKGKYENGDLQEFEHCDVETSQPDDECYASQNVEEKSSRGISAKEHFVLEYIEGFDSVSGSDIGKAYQRHIMSDVSKYKNIYKTLASMVAAEMIEKTEEGNYRMIKTSKSK